MADLLPRIYDVRWYVLGGVLSLIILWALWPYASVIVYAIFVYYICRPIKRRLRKYIKNEAILALVCLFLLALPLILILGYAGLVALDQLDMLMTGISQESLSIEQITNATLSIQALNAASTAGGWGRLDTGMSIEDLYHSLQTYSVPVRDAGGILLGAGLTLIDILLKMLIMLLIAFLLLLYDERLGTWARSTFPELWTEQRSLLSRYAGAVDDDLEKIFFGNILCVLIFAVVATIVYSGLNIMAPHETFLIPYPLLLGLFCGVAALLPVLGPWMVDVPLLAYIAIRSLAAGTLVPNTWYFLFMVFAIFVIEETLPGYLLRPFVSHGKVNIGLLMLAYIIGPLVFGFAGLFIGVILLSMYTHFWKIVVPDILEPGKRTVRDWRKIKVRHRVR